VVLSATKLLKRILAPDDVKQQMEATTTMKSLHEHTFGIASDPICQFGVVFSALIHDCGHCGISNARLAIEEPMIAEKYDGRSIAEQRSLEIAFELLNQPRFKKLRACIYHNEDECVRFRHVVVNSVMATDIFDKEWTALRNARWNTAFHEKAKEKAPDSVLDMNRKATIVLEHIILASDVAHTMQHFFIYQKWNERLFQEMYNAFLVGRSEKDPSIGWYGGELWFYDNYIIPLAHKLKECGVFGVNSDEYLDYAMQNRQEWEQKGAAMVEAMVERAHKRAAKKQNQMETVMEEVIEDSSCAVVETEALESLDEEDEDDEEEADEAEEKAAGQLETLQEIVEVTVESLPDARPTCRTVMAPSGKLYVVLNTTSEKGLIRVDEVARESPLLGLLHAGEYIVSIDGTPTLNLPAYEVGVLLNKNRERRLEVVADGAIARALVNLAEKRDEDSTDKFFSM
jgi:3'5'-cyclic nucleotide phosphodiesterase